MLDQDQQSSVASSEEEDDVLSVDLSDESARREIKKEEDTE